MDIKPNIGSNLKPTSKIPIDVKNKKPDLNRPTVINYLNKLTFTPINHPSLASFFACFSTGFSVKADRPVPAQSVLWWSKPGVSAGATVIANFQLNQQPHVSEWQVTVMKIFVFLATMFFSVLSVTIAESSDYQGVSSDLVTDLVAQEAGLVFGPVKVYKIDTFYNIDGEPEVYCFTLYRKTDPLPDFEGLVKRINQNAIQQIELRRRADEAGDRTTQKELRAQARLLQNDILKTDDFVTVIAAAHEGHQPIIKMHAGLPPHITLDVESKNLLKERKGQANARLKRVYYFDIMTIGTEYEDLDAPGSSADDSQMIVDPYKKRILTKTKIRESQAQKEMSEPEKRDQAELRQKKAEQLKNKWKKVKDDFTSKNKNMASTVHDLNQTGKAEKENPTYREIIVHEEK